MHAESGRRARLTTAPMRIGRQPMIGVPGNIELGHDAYGPVCCVPHQCLHVLLRIGVCRCQLGERADVQRQA